MANRKNTLKDAKLPLVLLGILLVLFVVTVYNPPAGRLNWLLEVGPALIGIIILIVTYKAFPMSQVVYWATFIVREALLRKAKLQRDGWLFFIVISVVFAIAAFWELLEWWTLLISAPEVGAAFLGMQGDIWDAQWDMFLALIGSVLALIFFSRRHDRSMEKIKA